MRRVPRASRSKGGSVWVKTFGDARLKAQAILLVDFGSTYTKAAAVELATGRLLGVAQHPTTVDSDLLIGFEAVKYALGRQLSRATFVDVLACSSAGGGLRLAVIGLEPDLTAEAARRSALNAGARVVTVIHGGLSAEKLVAAIGARPDIVLLVGGTNGGNASALVESSQVLVASSLEVPIVLAGNEDAQPAASQILQSHGKHLVAVPNLMPEIGMIQEPPVREAIRAIFIEHVIGGKHLSSGPDFAAMVQMPTPDAVLTAAQLLAEGTDDEPGLGDLVVIDLGGATTDVHSIVRGERRAGYVNDLLAPTTARRTVEADLGLRWNATGIIDAAETELSSARRAGHLRNAAHRRVAEPLWIAGTATDMAEDLELAGYAIEVAMRRHAGRLTVELSPSGAALRKSGRDLRAVSTIVLSGGIFRHASPEMLSGVLPKQSENEGLMLPQQAGVAIDRAYVLAAAGILASRDRRAAFRLARNGLTYLEETPKGGSNCSALN